MLAAAQSREQIAQFLHPIWRHETRHRRADDLCGGIAVQFLGAGVPARDLAVETLAENCVFRVVVDGGKESATPLGLVTLPLAVFDRDSHGIDRVAERAEL